MSASARIYTRCACCGHRARTSPAGICKACYARAALREAAAVAIAAEVQPMRVRAARSVKVSGPPRVLTADDIGPPECIEEEDDA